MKYKPGKKPCNAGALSRMALPVTARMTPVLAETVRMMGLLNSALVAVKEIQEGTSPNVKLLQVVKFVQGWPHTITDEAFQSYSTGKQELNIQQGCLWGNRVAIPPKAREKKLGHPGICHMKSLASYIW